ncbi:MAG: disulfide bond formation protein B [Bdellovibrionales bacterium]
MFREKFITKWNLIFLAWLVACLATAGSLFFSEVMSLPPCALCWYQRICMYPIVIILLPAVIAFDRSVLRYSMPLVALGWSISIYHNLVYYGVISESLSPCSMGVSCKAQFIQWAGLIDIPQLSLLAFSLLIAILLKLTGVIQNEK